MRGLCVLLALAGLLFQGCATAKYKTISTGEVGGRVTIEWVGSDKFIYRPDATKPFYFKRANGEVIQPGPIYTDGGTIPRVLWSIRGYSPWGFGPAYIAHDWLFSAHHCHLPAAKNHTVFTAADVLAECMKTLMESNPDVLKSPALLYTVDEAVRLPVAQQLWDKGECLRPPEDLPQAQKFLKPLDVGALRSQVRWTQTFDLDRIKKR